MHNLSTISKNIITFQDTLPFCSNDILNINIKNNFDFYLVEIKTCSKQESNCKLVSGKEISFKDKCIQGNFFYAIKENNILMMNLQCRDLLPRLDYSDLSTNNIVPVFINKQYETFLCKKFYNKYHFIKNLENFIIFTNHTTEKNYKYLPFLKLNLVDLDNICNKGLKIFLLEPLNFKNDSYENLFLIYLEKFISINKIKNCTVYLCEHNIKKLQKKYKLLNLHTYDAFLEICGEAFLVEIKNNIPNIKKKFFCGNILYTHHRHIISTYLCFRSVHLSWNHNNDVFKIKSNNSYFNYLNINKIIKNNTKIHNRLSFGNKILTKNKFTLDNKKSSIIRSIKKFYEQAFCCIITETLFTSPFANISEKTLAAIAYKKPFIIVGSYGSLKYIKSLGFKTFNKWWDESYDNIKNNEKRMIKILELIDDVDTWSMTTIKNIYNDQQEVLDYNQRIFIKNYQK